MEGCKAFLRKYESFTHMKIPQSRFFGNPFERHFWKTFLSFKNSFLGYSKRIFQKEIPGGYAIFNVFESQCPKIKILSKVLKAKLSKCP